MPQEYNQDNYQYGPKQKKLTSIRSLDIINVKLQSQVSHQMIIVQNLKHGKKLVDHYANFT